MDSVSHIRVANLLMDYVEQTCGVTFDQSGFIYGNLKPDLTGTYLTKRHNPSIMMDEVMEKIRTFTHGTKSARCASSVTGGPGEAYKKAWPLFGSQLQEGLGIALSKAFTDRLFSGGAAMLTISFQRFCIQFARIVAQA